MQKLIEGVHKFRNETFGNYRTLFRKLSKEGQKPHTLFITCSDSRVMANLITQSKPGDLFVVKNIGNIVPPAHVTDSTNSTAAAIEFAVAVLHVGDIVICGHSQCGAMACLMGASPIPDATPRLRDWLSLAEPVRDLVTRQYPGVATEREQLDLAAAENVLFGLANLHNYPCVQEALAAGTLRLHGWYFKIATAELFAYDPESRQFSPLLKDETAERSSR
jgi:carbonic anhydrase